MHMLEMATDREGGGEPVVTSRLETADFQDCAGNDVGRSFFSLTCWAPGLNIVLFRRSNLF